MKKRFSLLIIIVICLFFFTGCKKDKDIDNPNLDEGSVARKAATFYCAPDATSSGAGTESDPTSFFNAVKSAVPGDVFLLKGGSYKAGNRIQLDLNGAAGKYITVKPASDSEDVIFDFSEMAFLGSNRGIQVYGDYWHFYDITVTGAGDNGMYISGNHNLIENCVFYNNRDTGLQIGRGYSEETTIDEWPSYNLIKNCTSFGNFDGETFGENADGFAAKLTVGYGNVFDGCIAYRNSDDGWDLYAKEDSGNIGTVVLYNCVSFENGYLPYKIDRIDKAGNTYQSYDTLNGDGIGFKLGGSTMEGDVIMENCVAFNNKLHGFSDNSNPGVISLKNCTAYNNCIGLNHENGEVDDRGIEGVTNKSNNIDLARTNKSYNNFYGVVSYINNQAAFDGSGDSSYNEDAFRGSVAYSIFNTGYNAKVKTENYVTYTGYTDGSSYHSETVDKSFSGGVEFVGISDESFASLENINAVCDGVANIASLASYHDSLRNSDKSVNLGDLLKIVDENLLTYANNNPIGANLSKSSFDAYTHYANPDFTGLTTENEIAVRSAMSVIEVLVDSNAVYQNFEIPKLVHGCDVVWSSSNASVLKIEKDEKVSVSTTVLGNVTVTTPKTDTSVKLTATVSRGDATEVKEFDLIIKGKEQTLGNVVSTDDDVIRVDIYGQYIVPKIYALDDSSISNAELPADLYDIDYSYRYASSRVSQYYSVDGVYTSVPGVYEVTATATLKSNGSKSVYAYKVYVVDPNCEVDFSSSMINIALTRDGFMISGELSNIDGAVYAVASETPIALTRDELLNHKDVQSVQISTDYIDANFVANNKNIKTDSTTQYYVNYVVANRNKTNTSNEVRSFQVDIFDVTTVDQFYQIATKGSIEGTSGNPTIYSLKNDLDFTDYEWVIKAKADCAAFYGLFNGNNHTIKNLIVEGDAGGSTQTVNLFYKVSGGTVMNLNFDNIKLKSTDLETGAKIIGIVGDLQGGYLHNIKMHNIAAYGREGVGALVGQVTGGYNYITQCSLVNECDEEGNTDYVIAAYNKYAGGIVGNCQKNSDQAVVDLTIQDCYVKATIGNGEDAGGNTGGIIGRAKNDSTACKLTVERCYYEGLIIAKGQYNAGIVGDFDNGVGHVVIKNNYSVATFRYNGELLDPFNIPLSKAEKYAHKNSNPIVGRAVKAEAGIYETKDNFGTWSEYYADHIISQSIVFDLSSTDEETGETKLFNISELFVKNRLKMDLDNVWKFEDGVLTLR